MNGSDATLMGWIRNQVPTLSVVSASEPTPVLLDENLIAVSDDPERARAVLRDWERIENADGAVGLIVLSRTSGTSDTDADRVDPERITGHAARRTTLGAVPGVLIGAVLGALIAAFVSGGWGGAVIGGALGGAALGLVAGAFTSVVSGSGWSRAYTEGFVPPDAADVVIASIHSTSRESITAAIDAAPTDGDVKLFRIDRDGAASPIRRP